MTAIRQRWHRSAVVAGTGVAALVGAGIFAAAPASAHTPVWAVDCSSVSVNLSQYNAGVENTLSITAGDKSLLSSQKFGSNFSKKFELPKHSSPLKVHLVVKAGDGDQFSRDEFKTSPVCHEAPSPTPTTSKPAPSPSESSSEAAPAPSEKPSTAPKGGGHDLAETGSSSATPVIAGIAGVVLLAGAGMVVVARKRRSAQH